jgi:hypothetical protein
MYGLIRRQVRVVLPAGVLRRRYVLASHGVLTAPVVVRLWGAARGRAGR